MSAGVGAGAGAGAARAEVADLRSDIRHWRRGRVTTSLAEVLQDAYVAVFSAVVLGAMVGNALLVLRRDLGVACAQAQTGGQCRDAQQVLPWLTALLALVAVLAVARLVGPVFVSPAVSSWLMTAPVDRTALLRRRLLVAVAAGLVGAPVVLPAALLGGLSVVSVVGLCLGTGLGASALVAVGAAAQADDRPRRTGPLVALQGLLALLAWALLLGLALGVELPIGDLPAGVWGVLVVVAAAAVVGATTLAVRRLGQVRRERVAAGGALAPALSGALASLDLALVHDVVLAHRWRAVGAVRTGRGGPSGLAALVWSDWVRARRSPARLAVLVATVVVPYAAAAIGAGRLTVLIGVISGFLAALPLLVALRVLTRGTALARMLPYRDVWARTAALVVPGVACVLLGLASAPALVSALRDGWSTALLGGLAVGLGSLAAAARWMCGRPPDYERPLIATPAGAVPTNLYGSVFRGFDISVLVALPLLIWATPVGAAASIALSGVVLSVLVSRD